MATSKIPRVIPYDDVSSRLTMTATKGSLVSGSMTARRKSGYVSASFRVKNSSKCEEGDDIFVGRINDAGLYPLVTAYGAGYTGARMYTVLATPSDNTITVRLSKGTVAANAEVQVGIIYLTRQGG